MPNQEKSTKKVDKTPEQKKIENDSKTNNPTWIEKQQILGKIPVKKDEVVE